MLIDRGTVRRFLLECLLLASLWGCGDPTTHRGTAEVGADSAVNVATSTTAATPTAPAKPSQSLNPDIEDLEIGKPIVRELTGKESHTYRVRLEVGDFHRIEVEQLGIDVVVKLFGPQGEPLMVVDGLTFHRGVEHVFWRAESTGAYRLVVEPYSPGASTGEYRIAFLVRRPATPRDEALAAAAKALAECAELRDQRHFDRLRTALVDFKEALAFWDRLENPLLEAQAFHQLAFNQLRLGNSEQAVALFDRSVAEYAASGEIWGQAWALYHLRLSYEALGDLERAVEAHREALELLERVGDPRGEAIAAGELGLLYAEQGQHQKALHAYDLALEKWREVSNPASEAVVLHNRGKSYLGLGNKEQALDDLRRALALREQLGDLERQASTLTAIGQVYHELRRGTKAQEDQDLRHAIGLYHRALRLSLRTGAPREQAFAQANLGIAYSLLKEHDRALEFLENALRLYDELGFVSWKAIVLHNIGYVYDRLGQQEEALAHYRRALEILRRFGHVSGQSVTLVGIADLLHRAGDSVAAIEHLEEALALIEDLRRKPESASLRSSFFATKQTVYDEYIHLLMELHRLHPAAGYDAQALHVSERARTRSLLESLTESDAEIERGVPADLRAREQELERALSAEEVQRQRLLENHASEERLERSSLELRTLLREYRKVRGQIRASSPVYASLTQPQPLTAEEIRHQVVDTETLLLQYDLGRKQSYLWAVTSDRLESFVLPPEAEIEEAARRAYELLTHSNRRSGTAPSRIALEALAEILLAPVADRLGEKRRLLFVGEGALHYIPFGVLPAPRFSDRADEDDGDRALVFDHEISSLPSATALAVLRQRIERRAEAPLTIAVIADPVFKDHDPRYRNLVREQAIPRVSQVRQGSGAFTSRFERLAYAAREAEAILALVSPEQSFSALGFAANVDTVTEKPLHLYRYLHFATHGDLNTAHPELSSLVLSMLDEDGRPREGFLRVHEIYNLDLPADLIVLSACQTALGKEIRGEGLVGLTQGFMYAGAARVIVSLWQVDDHATAELMTQFYHHLLVEGYRPAAALRAAQLSIAREKPWRSPFYWAGFVLQGEW